MSGSAAFTLFFAVFWAIALDRIVPSHLFDFHKLFDSRLRRAAFARGVVGVVVLNALPIAWLLWVLTWLPTAADAYSVAAGATAAISVFGFSRLAVAIVRTESVGTFYHVDEVNALTALESEQWRKIGPQTLWAHLLPAAGYLAIPPLVAMVLIGFR
jgi:hypothetical protein